MLRPPTQRGNVGGRSLEIRIVRICEARCGLAANLRIFGEACTFDLERHFIELLVQELLAQIQDVLVYGFLVSHVYSSMG